MKQLTKSFEDYIEAIYILEKENKIVRSVDIANKLGVSKPAVNKAMNELIGLELITKSDYSDIEFTGKGRELAKKVYRKHTLIYDFLIKIGVPEEISKIDCCKIEHVVSEETIKCIEKYLKEHS